jgi:putative ABC transport system permease protein
MDVLMQDLRYGARSLLRNPGFAAIAIVALGLGIGANTAIFSVVNSVLLRPLPYADPGRLVSVWNQYPGMNLMRASVSGPDYVERRDQNTVFEGVAVYAHASLNLTGSGEPERIHGLRASANLFHLLGVPPALGRGFLEEEDHPGRSQVAVVSDRMWRRTFGADRGLVGRTVRLNGVPYTVAGVAPPEFYFPEPGVDIWIPIALKPEDVDAKLHGFEYLTMIARLRPGAGVAQAQADLDVITRRFLDAAPAQAREFFESNRWGAGVAPLMDEWTGSVRPALLVLLGAVVCVLLIACANVSNLLLARTASRQKEMAVRYAVGAGRGRVVRMLLTESVLLALAGGGLGLLVAAWGIDLLVLARPANLPRIDEIGIDGRVLLFTSALSILSGLVFGIAPALQMSARSFGASLKEGGRAGSAPGRSRLRATLVTAQISLALVLLVGAGLLVRTFDRIQQVDPGFRDAPRLLTMSLSLPDSRYAKAADKRLFFDRLLERLRALPGVTAAAANSLLPLAPGASTASFRVEGQRLGPGEGNALASVRLVTPGYLAVMGIPLRQGRDLEERDAAAGTEAAVIEETLARRFFPGESPIGRRVTFSELDDGQWFTVVGVAGTVKHSGLAQESFGHLYIPYAVYPAPEMFVVLRTQGDPRSAIAAVRGAVRAVDPEQPIHAVRTMDDYVDDALAQPRFRAVLLGMFGGVALLLAVVGIYGVMAFSVTQRTHEIGVRLALGARPRDVLRMIVAQGLRLTLAGVVLGLLGAVAVTRALAGLLFGVGSTDPATFATVPIVLAAAALLASYIPARRATRVDPMVALRCDG